MYIYLSICVCAYTFHVHTQSQYGNYIFIVPMTMVLKVISTPIYQRDMSRCLLVVDSHHKTPRELRKPVDKA